MAQLKAGSTVGGKRILDEDHLADDVSQGEVHGLRLNADNKLEYFNGTEWVEVKGGGYPVNIVKNVNAKGGDAKVLLTWEDPEDVVVDGHLVAEWNHTRVMRKEGSYPLHEEDGELVVSNGVRNAYKDTPYEDTGLENDKTYYYSLFPVTTDEVVTVSELSRAEATPTETKVYGLEWNQTLDTYQRLDDAVGMVAITQGQNNFSNVYPWSDMKRCNLDDNGNILAYFGDPTYKDDGSNGQVMVQIPKFWYKSEMVNENGNKKYRWWISDNEIDGFKLHPAFIRNGVEKDVIYIGAYEGYVSGGMLHSRAGVTPTASRTIVQFRQDAQARGAIWHQQDFLTTCAIQLLYLIEYAHFDSQTKIGQGITNDTVFHQTGETAQYGNQSFGNQNNSKIAMSYRGIENLYGNYWQWIDGININNHRAYIADHNFKSNKFDGHYRQVGFTNATSNGYVKDIGWASQDDFMFLAIDSDGSDSSYLHDYYRQDSGARISRLGGSRLSGSRAGAFCWGLTYMSAGSASHFVAALLCVP